MGPGQPALHLSSPKKAAATLWVGGSGRLGAGSWSSRPRLDELAPPHPLRGVLRVKRRAGRAGLHLRCTKAERGRDGAGGLAGAQNWPRVLSA